MVLVWMMLSMMVARAEDTTPQQASLAALESTIPEWAARNAGIQTKESIKPSAIWKQAISLRRIPIGPISQCFHWSSCDPF